MMPIFNPSPEVIKLLEDAASDRIKLHAKTNYWKGFSFSLNFYRFEDNNIGEINYQYFKHEDDIFGICSELFYYINDEWIGMNLIE